MKKSRKSIAILTAIAICLIITSCEQVASTKLIPDPNRVTTLSQATIELQKADSLKDLWDNWGGLNLAITLLNGDNGNPNHIKTVTDIFSAGGWSGFEEEPNCDVDIIIEAWQQDSVEIKYLIDIDDCIAVYSPTSTEFEEQPHYSHKSLSESDIQALKEIAYYYFSQHLE
ncbi:MAG: hypothetical protein IKS28_07345 [Clostridia bacterium]|nr:hypothetical protein [Clostridia bacterium]